LVLGGHSERITVAAVVNTLLLALLVSGLALGGRDLVGGLRTLSAFDSFTQKLAARARTAMPGTGALP
jgi:hypothetical protein